MPKLYCYVDETGQDTEGRLFIVAVVLVGDVQEKLLEACSEIERTSGKGNVKWRKSDHSRRLAYLRQMFTHDLLHGGLCYCVSRGTKNYDVATVLAIAGAIKSRDLGVGTTISVYIDALSKTKKHEYGNHLRRLGVSVKKLRGIAKDENDPFIRIADAIAGFVRDALENKGGDVQDLFNEARRSGALVEVESLKEQ